MDRIHTTYLSLAWLVWTAVGALAGAVVGLLLNSHGREMIFPITLGVGMVWLIMVQLILRSQPKKLQLPAPATPSKPVLAPEDVSAEVLTSEAARAWLDEFLVKQQEK